MDEQADPDVTGDGVSGIAAESDSLRCRQAVCEIITAAVVYRDVAQAKVLIEEHLQTHGRGLIDSTSMFIVAHTTDNSQPQLAQDRFSYLLTRIGQLVDLAAEVNEVDPGEIVLELVRRLEELAVAAGDDLVRQAYRAALTCLVAHRFVRIGRHPWGIQSSLDAVDMLACEPGPGPCADPRRRLLPRRCADARVPGATGRGMAPPGLPGQGRGRHAEAPHRGVLHGRWPRRTSLATRCEVPETSSSPDTSMHTIVRKIVAMMSRGECHDRYQRP